MWAAIGVTLAAIGALYAIAGWWLAWRWHENAASMAPSWHPAVSVLKPLCGAEPGLSESLRSFLRLPYRDLQMVFGARDAVDPALTVVAELRREFPDRDIELVVDPRQHGDNPKTSNLINMLARARHPVLVISDSDVRVGERYLAAVLQALAPEDVGAVTCLYRGRPGKGLASRLAALFINDWYFAAILISHALGDRKFASGATIALRRRTLDAIGGLAPIANHLADDWALGDRVRSAGLRTELAQCVVETEIADAPFSAHAARELRWMRTIRTIAPLGYAFMGLSFALPVALVGLALAPASPWALALAAVASIGRIGLHLLQRARMKAPMGYDLALIPLRDALLAAIWIAGFLGRSVSWRGRRYRVSRGGRLTARD
jgi:ceramide glucosyltransferase